MANPVHSKISPTKEVQRVEGGREERREGKREGTGEKEKKGAREWREGRSE